jgi:hypothetical protein
MNGLHIIIIVIGIAFAMHESVTHRDLFARVINGLIALALTIHLVAGLHQSWLEKAVLPVVLTLLLVDMIHYFVARRRP